MRKINKKIKSAFTLIELVVVIAVIAILSAVSVAAYMGVISSSRESIAEQEAAQISLAIKTESVSGFKAVNGSSNFKGTFTNSGLQITSTASNETISYSDSNVYGLIHDMIDALEGTNHVASTCITAGLKGVGISSNAVSYNTGSNNGVFYGKKESNSIIITAFAYYSNNQYVVWDILNNKNVGTTSTSNGSTTLTATGFTQLTA